MSEHFIRHIDVLSLAQVSRQYLPYANTSNLAYFSVYVIVHSTGEQCNLHKKAGQHCIQIIQTWPTYLRK